MQQNQKRKMSVTKLVESSDNVSKKYIKLEQHEHVLKRPDMYIGSIQQDQVDTWTFKNNQMSRSEISYIPGLYKIFDEILVNSIDHTIRLQELRSAVNEDPSCSIIPVKNIKVNIDKETGIIEVYNDGDGIEVVLHEEHQVYIPELIFGNMLTSSNYNNDQERIIGGLNGIGAKACNIFSEFFEITTVDHYRKLKYHQRFENNMTKKLKPKITKSQVKPFTTFRFKPDYAKFNCEGLSDDMYNLLVKRVFDACAMTRETINVYFNGTKLAYKTFEKYINLYTSTLNSPEKVYEKANDRWEYAVVIPHESILDTSTSGVSFVNGLCTIRGGKHVDYITNQIIRKLTEKIVKCNKTITSVKPTTIKNNMLLFLKCTIVNPTFDSQSKETLTTPMSKFGSKAEVSDKFIEKLYKTKILEKIIKESQLMQDKSLSKTDGKKRTNINGIPHLDDAFYAGTKKSKQCTLILTEGLSAATFAISGLSVVGRDYYGVFPLKGKILNAKDASVKKISENDEITNIKKIVGLESGKMYNDTSELRYGKIMILSDQDRDGSHIKGLLFNLFHTMWPSLLKNGDFMISMLTPIVKVKKQKKEEAFYSLQDFQNWKTKTSNWSSFTIKYFKGLGTSTAKEAKEYFEKMKTVNYIWNNESNSALDLAFDKKNSDLRKEWLSRYDKQQLLDYSQEKVSFNDFVNKDLIHFSKYDVERSIPSLIDGLKISQRKILYACFKKNLTSEIKVAQLAGYVSEVTDYLHGEASLQMAIVSMAQDYMGSNNINYLVPNGQFGTRIHQGKDASQARYIFTELSKVTSKIFKSEDQNVLHYLNEEGHFIEPEFYMPIIPTILINGAIGIGTGFSTNIPSFNPRDIISAIQIRLNESSSSNANQLKPWYYGFKGTIELDENGKYYSKGVYKLISSSILQVTELPVGTSTQDYKTMLEDFIDKGIIKQYKNSSTDTSVLFTITFASEADCNKHMKDTHTFKVNFKLLSYKFLSVTNMYAFDEHGCIHKYATVNDIIDYYYTVRLSYYQKRKDNLLEQLNETRITLENKIRFLTAVIERQLVVSEMSKSELEETLERQEYVKQQTTSGQNYDYLVGIPIYNLTRDKLKSLQDQLAKTNESIKKLQETDIKDMWRSDLDELVVALDKFDKERDEKDRLEKKQIENKRPGKKK